MNNIEAHYLLFKGQRIYYSTTGSGDPLLLLHGYQADSRIWQYIVPLLTNKYKLIIPDLPGHGKSPLIQPVNSMEFLAEVVYRIYLTLGVKGISIAGHSMGGYVALAFTEKNKNLVDNLYLINSHPFADSMNKILARNREAEFIEQGKKQLLLRSFLQNSFFEPDKNKIKQKVDFATKIAITQPDKGMLADLAGMMARHDKTDVISKSRVNTKIIVTQDEAEFMGLDYLNKKRGSVYIIKSCGHLSIIEKPDEVYDAIIR